MDSTYFWDYKLKSVRKNVEPAFKTMYIFPFQTVENCVKIYVILIYQDELVFTSYENQKEKYKLTL